MIVHSRIYIFILPITALAISAQPKTVQSTQSKEPSAQASQSSAPKPVSPIASPNQQSTLPEPEKIEAPQAKPAPPATLSETGSMRPDEVKALLKNVRFAEYRINDLLADVHPENWKLPKTTLDSVNQTLKALRAQTVALEDWRAQFDQRTDSTYLGFQTYAAINSVLPRLNGVAESVREHETAGYAAQFSKAGGQLFDFQQTVGAYVGSLMHNQDQLLLALESNVASCQQNLSAAMRGQAERAKSMKNSRMGRPQRRKSSPTSEKTSGIGAQPEPANKPQ
jgi:hypothetical protein